VIGSNDIILEACLENHAEPAYLTTIVFTFPDDITLRSILPSCEEDTDNQSLMVICNVANPLGANKKVKTMQRQFWCNITYATFRFFGIRVSVIRLTIFPIISTIAHEILEGKVSSREKDISLYRKLWNWIWIWDIWSTVRYTGEFSSFLQKYELVA